MSGARTPDDLDDGRLRLVTVFFGVGLILVLLLFADGIGVQTLLWTALFTAVSPAMVFYSRYFIHEILLIFFTALALGAGWRYAQTRTARWSVIAGIGVGMMFATKETFVITLAAIGFAGSIVAWQNSRSEGLLNSLRSCWNSKHALLAFSAVVLVWLCLFSSFFNNWSGLPDSVRTYFPWLKRAGGESPHIHPWYFYLQRLAWFHPVKGPWWSEGLVLALAAIGCVVGFAGKRSPLHFFLAAYTLSLTAAYSIISYKTPWCLLSFYHGMIFLAGIGATAVVERFRSLGSKTLIMILLLGLTAQLAWQSWRASFVYAADRRNPYVYAQTSADLLNLVQRAEGLGHVASTGFDTVIKVIAPENDYWPLPWYLRHFKNIGWYKQLPADPFSPIIIVSSKLDARLDDRSERKWIMAGLTELRPGNFLELYVELELWKRYVETLPRDRE